MSILYNSWSKVWTQILFESSVIWFWNFDLSLNCIIEGLLSPKNAQIITYTLKPQYNEPRYSEFRDIVSMTQLQFWGFTKHTYSVFDTEKII